MMHKNRRNVGGFGCIRDLYLGFWDMKLGKGKSVEVVCGIAGIVSLKEP